MATPIALVYYLPEEFNRAGQPISPHEMYRALKDILPDYHVLAVPSHLSVDGSCEHLRLQVFHEKDFTEIQYNELKQLITDSLKEKTNGKD